jgi:hypothetical protein
VFALSGHRTRSTRDRDEHGFVRTSVRSPELSRYGSGMDWGTVGTAVLGSGIVGGGVSWLVARRESKDRQAQIALEREKWEHEKGASDRERAAVVLQGVLDWVRALYDQIDDFEGACRKVARDPEADRKALLGPAAAAVLSTVKRVEVLAPMATYSYDDEIGKVMDFVRLVEGFTASAADWLDAGCPMESRPTTDVEFRTRYGYAIEALHTALRKV